MPIDADNIRNALIQAYDRKVDERDGREVPVWKVQERSRFLRMLRDEGKSELIDIGSGPGTHATYFKQNGINVTCIDLSPGNVDRCRQKGLETFECDVVDLPSLGRTFDSAIAMSSLLHVPRSQLRHALSSIRKVLNSSGLFYWGQYGGEEREGIYEEDEYDPKRFFSLLDDEQIQEEAMREFDLEDFTTISIDDEMLHFQSLILRAK